VKKPSKKKGIAILMFLALIIAIFPEVASDTIDGRPSPDYGIYNEMESMQDEKSTRYNSPEILIETEERLDNMTITSGEQRLDLTSRRDIISPTIPIPEMLDIYDAMLRWDKTYNNQITDWLLPPPLGDGGPLNYYIYSKYITNGTIVEQWTNASLRPTLILPETNIDRWWGVDVNNDMVDDVEVFFGPELNWAIGNLINQFTNIWQSRSIKIPLTFRTSVHKLNDAPFSAPEFEFLEVFVAKAMSYTDNNFIFFYGMNFSNVATYFNDSVEITNIELGGIDFIGTLAQAIINQELIFNFADLVGLQGPYIARWDSGGEPLGTLEMKIATARLEFQGNDYEFLNRSWVHVDFKNEAPTAGEMWLDADETLSSFDEIRWIGSNVCDVNIRFFDSQENVTYAEIKISEMPQQITAIMTVDDSSGDNITIIDYDASSAMEFVDVKHYEFFDTEYEDITPFSIASGEVEWIHLFLNITNIPKRMYVKGLFYLEEVDDSMAIVPGLEIVGQLVQSIAVRLISRFTRISKTLSSIPYKIMNIAEEGGFAEFHTYWDQTHDMIDEVEFLFISGDYVQTTGNFFAFYNNTRSSPYPIAQISLSGRITDIVYFNSSFEDNIFAEVKMMNNKEFRAIYTDPINSVDAELIVSNVPGHMIIYETPTTADYNGVGTIIDEMRFVSDFQGSYMDFSLKEVSDQLYIEFSPSRTYIHTDDNDNKIGNIEFVLTTGPILRMPGNYLLLRHDSSGSVLSGRIKDISSIDYRPGIFGMLEVNFAQENAINVSLFDNRTELLSADLILDPIPKHLTVDLSGFLPAGVDDIPLPKLDNTGVMGLVSVIFAIATLGTEIFELVDETTKNALNDIGDILTELSFSYSTETHTTFIARILRGTTFSYSDVDWTHGISSIQTQNGNNIAMAAKLYLTGLPTSTDISTYVKGAFVFINLQIDDFTPKYNWLLLDVKGMQERDVIFYINDLKSPMNLDLHVSLIEYLNMVPAAALGSIRMDSDRSIGNVYARMRQLKPEISVTETFLSTIPKELSTDFNLTGNITVDFKANRGIEYMFARNSKLRNGEFHDVYIILHEIPDEMNIIMKPTTDYDMDGSLLQTLPFFEMNCSQSSMDAFLFADGEGVGQIGTAEIQIVNSPMTLSGKYEDGKFRMKSSGVDYFWVHVIDLPLMDGQKTKSVEIVGKDLKSFDASEGRLFGNYPIISIENAKGGEMQFVLDHEAGDSKIGVAVLDFKSVNGIPSSPSLLINGGSLNMEKGSSHVMIPAPVLSAILSVFV
jgi:hypothetical protein